MSTPRAGQPGATRLCPHCKATVLESASICPGCRHHLRFSGGKQLAEEFYTVLSVDGTIAHRQAVEPCEYCIVLDIANERGEQVMRQVVGVGALQPGELRHLNLSVQMLPLVAQAQPRPQATPAPSASLSLGKPAGVAAATPASAATVASTPPRTPPLNAPGIARPAGSPAVAVTTTPLATPAVATRPGGPVTGTGTPPAAGTTATPQPPGAAPGQRLRIFRKP